MAMPLHREKLKLLAKELGWKWLEVSQIAKKRHVLIKTMSMGVYYKIGGKAWERSKRPLDQTFKVMDHYLSKVEHIQDENLGNTDVDIMPNGTVVTVKEIKKAIRAGMRKTGYDLLHNPCGEIQLTKPVKSVLPLPEDTEPVYKQGWDWTWCRIQPRYRRYIRFDSCTVRMVIGNHKVTWWAEHPVFGNVGKGSFKTAKKAMDWLDEKVPYDGS